MLKKELLMTVGEGSGPVLSVYISPGNPANATVTVTLSSGDVVYLTTQNTERRTFKYSEIDVTSSISVRYSLYTADITTKNLIDSPVKPRAPEVGLMTLWIEDVTQSASILIEE